MYAPVADFTPAVVPAAFTRKTTALLLADLFYLISHKGASGASRIHPVITGYGMAAALVGELMVEGIMTTDQSGEWLMRASRHVPQDALTHRLLDTFVQEPQQYTLKDWLRYFALTAENDVAERLTRYGIVDKCSVRNVMLRRHTVYTPVRPDDFEGKFAILNNMLANNRITDWPYRWCAAIAYATQFHETVLDDTPDETVLAQLDAIVAQLGAGQFLMRATAALTGEAVVTRK